MPTTLVMLPPQTTTTRAPPASCRVRVPIHGSRTVRLMAIKCVTRLAVARSHRRSRASTGPARRPSGDRPK